MHAGGEKIIGNSRVTGFLDRLARSGSVGHAYLFTGPDGVGKKQAAIGFARALNCTCAGGARCESCAGMDTLSHPGVLLIADANKPLWFRRVSLRERLGLTGDDWRRRYAETVEALADLGYLEPPLPDVEADRPVDGFSAVTDHMFGKGSVPSRECYTPGYVAETVRKAFDRGKITETAYRLLRLLYEHPLSVMPYRGAIPIAYITQRGGWQHTRPIQSFLAMRSLMGGRKVVIVDDAHKMTPQAQNCLLKTLEEPPEDSVIVLVTAEPESLFPTIASRCQVIRFERLTAAEMAEAVASLVGDAGDAAGLIAALSGNCPGRALELGLRRIEENLDMVRDLLDGLAEGRWERVFAFSRSVLGEGSTHRRKLRDSVRTSFELIVFWLMEVIHMKAGIRDGALPAGCVSAMERHARAFDESTLLAMSSRIESVFGILPYNVDLSLLLDTTLLRLTPWGQSSKCTGL